MERKKEDAPDLPAEPGQAQKGDVVRFAGRAEGAGPIFELLQPAGSVGKPKRGSVPCFEHPAAPFFDDREAAVRVLDQGGQLFCLEPRGPGRYFGAKPHVGGLGVHEMAQLGRAVPLQPAVADADTEGFGHALQAT